MSLTYFSICITEYSLSWTCYSLSITCHRLCERGPGPWVTRLTAIWGSLMDPLLIIHGSVYWIGPPDMWINHSRKTTYTKSVFTGNFWRNLPYFLSARSYSEVHLICVFQCQGLCIQTTGKVWLSPVVGCSDGKIVNGLTPCRITLSAPVI